MSWHCLEFQDIFRMSWKPHLGFFQDIFGTFSGHSRNPKNGLNFLTWSIFRTFSGQFQDKPMSGTLRKRTISGQFQDESNVRNLAQNIRKSTENVLTLSWISPENVWKNFRTFQEIFIHHQLRVGMFAPSIEWLLSMFINQICKYQLWKSFRARTSHLERGTHEC